MVTRTMFGAYGSTITVALRRSAPAQSLRSSVNTCAPARQANGTETSNPMQPAPQPYRNWNHCVPDQNSSLVISKRSKLTSDCQLPALPHHLQRRSTAAYLSEAPPIQESAPYPASITQTFVVALIPISQRPSPPAASSTVRRFASIQVNALEVLAKLLDAAAPHSSPGA